MNISVKLKAIELNALAQALKCQLEATDPRTRCEAIVVILMSRLYKKLAEKIIFIEPRMYNIRFDIEIALAFIELFNMIETDFDIYSQNIIDRLIREFDQKVNSINQLTFKPAQT
ncbi:MAG: hypothetical protein ACTHK8_02090 [Ginsengibacter sp.]